MGGKAVSIGRQVWQPLRYWAKTQSVRVHASGSTVICSCFSASSAAGGCRKAGKAGFLWGCLWVAQINDSLLLEVNVHSWLLTTAETEPQHCLNQRTCSCCDAADDWHGPDSTGLQQVVFCTGHISSNCSRLGAAAMKRLPSGTEPTEEEAFCRRSLWACNGWPTRAMGCHQYLARA